MKRSSPLFLLILLLLLPCVAIAQRPAQGAHGQRGANGFDRYLHTKCDMVVHELGLTPRDSARFITIYHELQDEKSKLFVKYGGARQVRMSIENGRQVADTTLLRVLHNNAQLQVEDAMLEQRFMSRFLTVLSPLQYFQMQQAEQKFKAEMMKRQKPDKK